ncbi:MAG: glycosyltransferase family 92 protein [Halieaceae bacterium]|jgi:SAM-dependent methyltransferase|nr:glycosyltransferase family 92 protein [Halieaceae bacterium]
MKSIKMVNDTFGGGYTCQFHRCEQLGWDKVRHQDVTAEDLVVYTNNELERAMEYKVRKRVAWLLESRGIAWCSYAFIEDNLEAFDAVFTYDDNIVDLDPQDRVGRAQFHWAGSALRSQLGQRREQYLRINNGYKKVVVYRLSGADFLAELAGLARAMIYAFTQQRQLLLDADSLSREGGGHWHNLVQPLVPECSDVNSARIVEHIAQADDLGFQTLSDFQPERLSFGATPLQGFHRILGFFMQMLFWPAPGSQDRIDDMLGDFPLHEGYATLHIGADSANEVNAELTQINSWPARLLPLPEDQTLCVITDSDEQFSAVGRRLASGGEKVRAVNLRSTGNKDQLASDSRSMAELALSLGARRFVAARGEHLGQAVWLMHPRQSWCHLLEQSGPDRAGQSGDLVCVELQLRDGRLHDFELPLNSPHLVPLRELATSATSGASLVPYGLLQLPLNNGYSALTFSSRDIAHIRLEPASALDVTETLLAPIQPGESAADNRTGNKAVPNSDFQHHPAMNVDEGHLGGYMRSRHPVAVSEGWDHGDGATYNPALWDWVQEVLKVESVLDVGCGEGHAAAYFESLGCCVQGVDGSVQARRDSVIPQRHHRHDFNDGPYLPEGAWDLVWSCEFVEHVDECYTQHFLATFSVARKYILMTFAPPGQRGWHHVNCKNSDYWIEKVSRLGFRLDEDLTKTAREIAGGGHFRRSGLVFVRVDNQRKLPSGHTDSAVNGLSRIDYGSQTALPVNAMQVAAIDGEKFFLFLDIFVHPQRNKSVAVMPWYNEDWDPVALGIDVKKVCLVYRGERIPGRYIPHRLDSWEPCALMDFEHPHLERSLGANDSISFRIETGQHVQKFKLATRPPPAFNVLMSLVIKNENRWVRHFLEYYLNCLKVDHVLVYDNETADRKGLEAILRPYREAGKVTYIPWDFRWRNIKQPRKMIAQPQQEAHSLNRFANSRWIGFLDVDEFLRIPGKTLPEFVEPYRDANVDGLSFGLRWFQYEGALEFDEVIDAPLTFRHSRCSRLGRKRQKLLISPHQVRFARLHSLEEGGRELQIDDTDIYFHHYCQQQNRFKEQLGEVRRRDDYMLRFADQLALDGNSRGRPEKPRNREQWVGHIVGALAAAECERSNLDAAALAVNGYCGTLTRHFYNNICNFEDCRYLEIGSWNGASTVAAMVGNQMNLTCIDNFSQFNGRQSVFETNVRQFKGDNNLSLVVGDCFAMDSTIMGPFDVYLYDGAHSYESQYKAIEHFLATLAPLSVVIIDDWNWDAVRTGTQDALRDLGVNVLYRKEIILPEVNDPKTDKHEPACDSWWNGICILLIAASESNSSVATNEPQARA